MIKQGILLSGGNGSRTAPFNSIFSKHLLPIHNKFMIDYPLETMKNLGIENLTIVLGGEFFSQIVSHIKDGSEFGMNINYVYQNAPSGIAQAINLCKEFIKQSEQFAVVLGDNIFEKPIKIKQSAAGAQILLHRHPELKRFGVASVDSYGEIVKIEEKPKELDEEYCNYAITGAYIFNKDYFEYFKHIKPSDRGEYEITEILELYVANKDLDYSFIDGMWSDAGTVETINYVNNFFYEKNNK